MNSAFQLPRDRVSALEPATVEAHLLARGWEADPGAFSPEGGVYRHPSDPAAEILLPRDKSFIDFALRMAEAVQVLSVAERRKVWDVLDELSTDRWVSSPDGPAIGRRGADGNGSAKGKQRDAS